MLFYFLRNHFHVGWSALCAPATRLGSEMLFKAICGAFGAFSRHFSSQNYYILFIWQNILVFFRLCHCTYILYIKATVGSSLALIVLLCIALSMANHRVCTCKRMLADVKYFMKNNAPPYLMK